MIYTSARWADEAHTQVIGTDADGNTETVAYDHTVFRLPEHGPKGFEAAGGVIEAYVAAPAPTPTLTKRQIVAAMIVGANTLDPETDITSAIEAITDPVQRSLALNDWRNAPYYKRDHDLFNDENLLTAMNLTPEQVDQLWALAATLPA